MLRERYISKQMEEDKKLAYRSLYSPA